VPLSSRQRVRGADPGTCSPRTRLTSQQVLRQAGLSWDQVDRILLVGGSTHMPMTATMMKELSGKQPDNSLAVSEVVARGAALHAGIVGRPKRRKGKSCLASRWRVSWRTSSRSASMRTAWASKCGPTAKR